MSRSHIKKSIRFEVFKRDMFTCQYCGNKAPDVVLHLDHIHPVSLGGTDDILNLITSCVDCNLGKSDKKLSDRAELDKKHSELSQLQERKSQIEMMFQWQRELQEIGNYSVDMLKEHWFEIVDEVAYLNDGANRELKELVNRYGVERVVESMNDAVSNYFKGDFQSACMAFDKVSSICHIKTKDPESLRLYYVRGIMRNRFAYCDDNRAIILLKKAYKAGVPINVIELAAKTYNNWSQFTAAISAFESYIDNEGIDGGLEDFLIGFMESEHNV